MIAYGEILREGLPDENLNKSLLSSISLLGRFCAVWDRYWLDLTAGATFVAAGRRAQPV